MPQISATEKRLRRQVEMLRAQAKTEVTASAFKPAAGPAVEAKKNESYHKLPIKKIQTDLAKTALFTLTVTLLLGFMHYTNFSWSTVLFWWSKLPKLF